MSYSKRERHFREAKLSTPRRRVWVYRDLEDPTQEEVELLILQHFEDWGMTFADPARREEARRNVENGLGFTTEHTTSSGRYGAVTTAFGAGEKVVIGSSLAALFDDLSFPALCAWFGMEEKTLN